MLVDRYNRKIDYLRISITDRCNLRCMYCMPALGIAHKPQSQILSFEEIQAIVNAAAGLGIKKIRLTGGEPLLRKDLLLLIKNLKSINGLKEITLTTNGVYLSEYAYLLKKAGLDRINISLDSLIPEKFQAITRGGDLKAVLEGIESVFREGFTSLKINLVLLKGFNIDEVPSFANLSRLRPIHVRFIEYMPTDLGYSSYNDLFFSALEAKNICGSLGELRPQGDNDAGTAKVFRIEDFYGTVGFISPISEPFCATCNKLRLTSDGWLRSCLHSSKAVNLKQAMDRGGSEQELSLLIKEAVALRPQGHNLLDTPLAINSDNFSMCQIGG